jgi:hypothetical protein
MKPLTETELTQRLDDRGDLYRARAPGVYALALQTPPDADTAESIWAGHMDAPAPAGYHDRLGACARLCYVGSHAQSMYQRLCDHVAGHQSSTIMALYHPVAVVALWPSEWPRSEEYNRAVELSDERTAVWTDGALV